MKLSSILVVRRGRSSDSFSLCSGREILFLDLASYGEDGCSAQCPEGIVINRQIVQKKNESFILVFEKVFKEVVSTHMPGTALILDGGDKGTGWGEKSRQVIRSRIPGLPIYGERGGPGAALPVCLEKFQTGRELAGYLADLPVGKTAGGLYFSMGTDHPENGLKRVVELLAPWKKSSSVNFCIHLPVRSNTLVDSIAGDLHGLIEKGLAMMHWDLVEPGGRLPRELMWKASKQGLWNHVSGPDMFDPANPDRYWISNTPNVVHSFEKLGARKPGEAVTPPKELLSYGALPDLPGRAVWQVIRDPGLILPCLARIPKQTLLRMRAGGITGEIHCLGTGLEYFFKPPDEVPGHIMEEIIAMVDAGGSVDITHVRANLKTAYLIGYAMENGRVAGNSSLKHPRQVFIDRLRGMTGLDFTDCVERGYTSVRPEYRAMGIGATLLEGLTARAVDVKVFSIISEDNLATQKIALRNKTRKITTYFSDKLEKKMGVWMPEHMIPEKWDGKI